MGLAFPVAMMRSGVVPSAAWLPTDEASLLWWLDASALATITKDGSNLVSAWNNKKAIGFGNMTGASSSHYPTWLATGLNGYPCLEFNIKRMFGTFAHAGPSTLAIILAIANTGGTSNGVFFSFSSTGFTQVQSGGWAALKLDATNAAVNSNRQGTIYGTQAITFGTPFLLSGLVEATAAYNWLNGANPLTQAVAGTTDYDYCSVGAGITAANVIGSIMPNFRVSDIIVFSSGTTLLRQKAEGYMAHKVGLSSLLDASHPYKSAPP